MRRSVYATHRVEIEASDNCRQLVCFAPNDERKFIAVEPVTNVNNATGLAAMGLIALGMESSGDRRIYQSFDNNQGVDQHLTTALSRDSESGRNNRLSTGQPLFAAYSSRQRCEYPIEN